MSDPMSFDDFDPDAYAKRDDPETSWEAADALDPNSLRERLRAVYRVLKAAGPCHNDELVAKYHYYVYTQNFPVQTDQSVRSRRSELTKMGLCVDTGERFMLDTGRRAVIWAAV